MLRTQTRIENLIESIQLSREPFTDITLSEARDYIKVIYSDDDNLITDLISAGARAFEKYTGIAIRQTTVIVTYSQYGSEVVLPIPTIDETQSVTVQTRYLNGDWEDISTEIERLGQIIYPTDYAYGRRLQARYESNWQPAFGKPGIPDDIKTGILKFIATAYDDRQNTAEGAINRVPYDSMDLWKPYRIPKL